jgi:hypothetical protein
MEKNMKKMASFLLVIFTFIIAATGSSRTLKYVELGINKSQFRTEKCKSLIGLSMGIGLEYYPLKSFNSFFDLGLTFQQKKFILENRTWRSDPYYDQSEIEKANININISNVEIPIKIGYMINIKNKYRTNLFTGYSLSIPIMNNTKIKNQMTVPLGPEERKTYKFDYLPLDENYTIPSTNFLIGCRFIINRLAIIIIYSRALSITEGASSLSVKDKIDTLKISTAFLF